MTVSRRFKDKCVTVWLKIVDVPVPLNSLRAQFNPWTLLRIAVNSNFSCPHKRVRHFVASLHPRFLWTAVPKMDTR